MAVTDAILALARESNPDLWKRTDAVARIIDPSAFIDDWVISDVNAAEMFRFKQGVMQAVAIGKAQEVLKYLGVNTDTDWHFILTRLASNGTKNV